MKIPFGTPSNRANMTAKLKALSPVSFRNVRVTGGFWRRRMDTNRTVTLPLEYRMNRKTGAFKAYQWDWWDPARGAPPFRIWVGDMGKWIEAASYSLGTHPDPALQTLVDAGVASIVKGQKADGYLYANPIPRGERWTDLASKHELYDIGHAIEGAVARFEATGKRDFLDAMCRCVNLVDRTFGIQRGQVRGYDGHEEIELALVRLWRATSEERYLKLAKYFVDERGRSPNYFVREAAEAKRRGWSRLGWGIEKRLQNVQAHMPVREQKDAVGHAVRAMYLCSGMADVAAETGDKGLLAACKRLWKSAVERRMYVIGGVGSTAAGEAFTFDYDLPNETAYAETCANIGLVFFAHRMLQIEADRLYADVMERALYNGVLSGVSLDGRRFFYANLLTVFPSASSQAPGHVAMARRKWFGCACCPPNIARLIASLGQYVYSSAPGALYVHLYAASTATAVVAGRGVKIRQETDYPWTGEVKIGVTPEKETAFTLAVRVPGWCRAATIRVNGRSVNPGMKKGYAQIRKRWKAGDVVEILFPMPVERIEARPDVRMDCGKTALQRGPVVYCLEEIDNEKNLADIFLPKSSVVKPGYRPDLLGGCVVLCGKAYRRDAAGWGDALYRPAASKTQAVNITAVPYCLWGNRRPGEMLVWIRGD